MHMPKRLLDRRMLTTALAISAALIPLAAQAQAGQFPNKPVKLVSAYSLDSGSDKVLRVVAQRLARKWGQPVRVDNRPGGAGFVAINHVLNAPADGHTLLQIDSEQLAAMPYLQEGMSFDPTTRFDPVTSLFRTPLLVAVAKDSKWKNLSDLIAASKATPQAVNYGSWGVGSAGHLGAALLESKAGIKTKHIPYSDFGQLYTAISNGTVSWGLTTLGSSESVYKAGKIRYLAIVSDMRHPRLPQVPTSAESGGPMSLNVSAVIMLVAPQGTDPKNIEKIHSDVQSVLVEPEVRAMLSQFAFEPLSWGTSAIRAHTAPKFKQYERLIKSGQIQAD